MTDQLADAAEEHDEASVADVDDADRTDLPRWRRGTLLRDGFRLHWYKEFGIVLSVYLLYETIRNVSKGRPSVAFDHAMQVIGWQKALGINHEKAIQDWALHYKPLIIASNYYYGIAYIAGTIGDLALAVPPAVRRLPALAQHVADRHGARVDRVRDLSRSCRRACSTCRASRHQTYGFVDTLVKYPTFWSFDSPTMKSVSNQFAAMPSLHCGWALWGAAAVVPRVKTWWMKALAISYPVSTIFVVVVTANHYFLDAVGGAIIFVVGYGVARLITRAGRSGRAVSPAAAER